MSALTRSFTISNPPHRHTIQIHEPALTGDSLGHKTWGSAYLLAQHLHSISLPPAQPNSIVLELGAGTGLVGLAAALVWSRPVVLTDLSEIVPNLATNIALNEHLGGEVRCAVLDWSEPAKFELGDSRATVVIAADPVYDEEHPRMLVGAVEKWLDRGLEARFVLAWPRREAFAGLMEELQRRLTECGLKRMSTEEGTTMDDWKDEISVVWEVWKWEVTSIF